MEHQTQAAADALRQLSSLHRRQRIINLACALNMLRTAVALDNRQPVQLQLKGGAA